MRHAAAMTSPRGQLVVPDAAGFYHCMPRCVRQAWLCGEDRLTGQSFEHRRGWVEQRLSEFSDIFASLYAYEVMSNHVHVVLRVDPTAAMAWSDEDVAARWIRLFPVQVDHAIRSVLRRDAVRRRLRIKHYSFSTERIYLQWIRRFIVANGPVTRASWVGLRSSASCRHWRDQLAGSIVGSG